MEIQDWLTQGEELHIQLDELLSKTNKDIHNELARMLDSKNKHRIVDKLKTGTVFRQVLSVCKKNFNKSDKAQPKGFGPYSVTSHDKYDNHYVAILKTVLTLTLFTLLINMQFQLITSKSWTKHA